MSNVEQADATAKAEEAPVRLSSHMAILPEVVKERVTVLQDIQKKHDELEAKFHEERAALIAKYQKLYEPLYTRRADIVNGSEEVAKETPPADALAEVPRKGVPDFWLTALKTNEILAMQITEKDEVALKYLKDLKSFYIENPKGFKLEFHFDENPFFTNTVLTKEYHMVDEDEPILERATGTKIEWKPGKDLSKKLMKKKPKKGSKDAAPQTKLQECDTFFNFFNPPQIPEDDDDLDQDEAEELQDLMEQDYDVGATIRDKIIPHAVSWYTGEALQGEEIDDESDEEEDELDEEDEDEEDDDEEDDDDDDDEDEEPEQKPKVVATIPKSEESQQQ